jgi:putative oxidoreductase
LTEHGNFVVLNNGIEFAATYFVMLLALLYLGSGKAGVDYSLNRNLHFGL